MAELKDSGARREFASGAVRDIAEGKGRCDLLPLDIVGALFRHYTMYNPDPNIDQNFDYAVETILNDIDEFIRGGQSSEPIYDAICTFIKISDFKSLPGAIIDVSKHYEDGARKYAERNWEKGISCHCYVDSGIRHLLKWIDNWKDEPHDRAFIWNMLGLLWTVKHKSECNDLPYVLSRKEASKAEDKEWGSIKERLDLLE